MKRIRRSDRIPVERDFSLIGLLMKSHMVHMDLILTSVSGLYCNTPGAESIMCNDFVRTGVMTSESPRPHP